MLLKVNWNAAEVEYFYDSLVMYTLDTYTQKAWYVTSVHSVQKVRQSIIPFVTPPNHNEMGGGAQMASTSTKYNNTL